jgi:hypothetical protein
LKITGRAAFSGKIWKGTGRGDAVCEITGCVGYDKLVSPFHEVTYIVVKKLTQMTNPSSILIVWMIRENSL